MIRALLWLRIFTGGFYFILFHRFMAGVNLIAYGSETHLLKGSEISVILLLHKGVN